MIDKNTPLQVEKFFSRYPLRNYSKGDLLIWANHEPEGIFFIQSGRVRQFDIFENGHKVTVNTFHSGVFFPMASAINKKPNKYFFESLENTRVRLAPSQDVVDFIYRNPTIMMDLLGRVFGGIDGILQKMSYMMASDAKTRVIFELVTEYKRNKRTLIKLNEVDLASQSGLARETVNRQIAKLKSNKLIELTTNGIIIKNLPLLENLLR